jgi:anti-sigma-K factor RskA
MDHADAIELIESAALEPGGLDRLMAGDTTESAALAGHLAGCEECTAVLAETRRTTEALRLVAADSPSSDLRERTLALVAAVGRPRGPIGAQAGTGIPIGGGLTASVRGYLARVAITPRRWGVALVGVAAVFALLAAGAFVAADLQGQLDQARRETARLHDLYADVDTLLRQPSARLVALHSTQGAKAGSLVVDASSARIAVLTDDLSAPPSGMEYRCWVEFGGQRQAVGRMWFEDGLAYWSGPNASIASWPPGTVFGVSLEPLDQPASGEPVLSASL